MKRLINSVIMISRLATASRNLVFFRNFALSLPRQTLTGAMAERCT